MMASIELHIEQLVFDGFSGITGAELSMALQAELSRVLAERGLPNHFNECSLARLDAGTLHSKTVANAPAMAMQIAEAIHSRLANAGWNITQLNTSDGSPETRAAGQTQPNSQHRAN